MGVYVCGMCVCVCVYVYVYIYYICVCVCMLCTVITFFFLTFCMLFSAFGGASLGILSFT